jgi:hypothetical protein
MSSSSCTFCLRPYKDGKALHVHQATNTDCKKRRNAHLAVLMAQAMASDSIPDEEPEKETEPAYNLSAGTDPEFSSISDGPEEPAADGGLEATRPPRVTVETIEDEDDIHYYHVEEFRAESQAGATFGSGPTTFDAIRDDQILQGAQVLGPFESEEEWQLAKWLIKNVGHNQMDSFLKLPIVSQLPS